MTKFSGTEERPLAIYERSDSSIVLTDSKELIEQAERDKRENYVLVRDNLTELVENVRNVVLDAVTEVRTNPSARMYETFSLLAKTYAELNLQTLELPNKILGENTIKSENSSSINQTAVFVRNK